ncbi:MAG: HAD family phosphatase [Clostridia bacterium]|nr:HAD family phosphatase [Clostridia bacterium]
MIQAVVFDLDDTLLRDDRTISSRTVDTLRRIRRMGVHVIPASGRIRESMHPYVEQLGCASCYISGNGAQVWSSDHSLLMSRELSPALAREAVSFANEHDCYAQIYDGGRFLYDRTSEYSQLYARSASLEGIRVPALPEAAVRPTPKVLLISSPEHIAQLLPKAQARFEGRMTATCSKPIYLEITPPDATKGNALRWCAEHLGFSLARTMAFGDSLNDMSMLALAGHGVAMGNAREDVKSLIRRVCPSNNEDGVAQYIQQHLLQQPTGG